MIIVTHFLVGLFWSELLSGHGGTTSMVWCYSIVDVCVVQSVSHNNKVISVCLSVSLASKEGASTKKLFCRGCLKNTRLESLYWTMPSDSVRQWQVTSLSFQSSPFSPRCSALLETAKLNRPLEALSYVAAGIEGFWRTILVGWLEQELRSVKRRKSSG